jgi:Zn-dependent protease with chaperone function
MDEQQVKQQTRRIMTGLFLQVAGLTIGVVILAILVGMWIGQQTGEQSILNWLPLFVCLPINLWISSKLGKNAVARISRLRYAQQQEAPTKKENE